MPIAVDSTLWYAWLFFWIMFALALVTDAARAPRASDLVLKQTLPDTLRMGSDHRLALTLRLPRADRPVRTAIKLDTSDGLEPPPVTELAVGTAETAVTFPLRPLRRGTATLDVLWVRQDGPLGLLERRSRHALDHTVEVVPNVRAVRDATLEFMSLRELQAGLRIEQYSGHGSEFDSLREFARGMDRRTIDWKHSARHTKLLARQYRAERNRQVVVAIDTGRLMAEPIDGVPRLDHAIHAALVLAYFSSRAGDQVGLYAFGDRPATFSAPRPGMQAYRTMLQLTAGLDYGTGETNFTLGLTNLMTRLSRRSLIVVMTDFVDSVTAELMSDNVERLARRHLVVFVSLRDPTLALEADRAPSSMLALGRAVVADTLIRDRDVVMARLRRSGVMTVDAAPSEVNADLLNHYLRIKRRELI